MKKILVTCLFVLALAAVSPQLAVADDGLILTGTLADSGTRCFKDSDDIFIYLTVSFQARNDLNRKLYLLPPSGSFEIEIFDWRGVSDMIEKAPSIKPLEHYKNHRDRLVYFPDGNPYRVHQNKENILRTAAFPYFKDSPPPPFLSLEPGGYSEFTPTFYLSPQPDNMTVKNKLGEVCREPDPAKRVMPTLKELGFTDGKFRVRYSFSARDHKEYSTALSDLKDRLKPFGHLPLSPTGDIVYNSDYIILAP